MAEQVTERLGVTDDNTLAQAKKFLRRRYAMVFDSQLWSDSLVAVSYTNTDEEEVIHVPNIIDKVLQIRVGDSGSSHTLQQINHQQVFQINPDALDEVGDRVAWTELSPAATWDPVVAANALVFTSTDANDTTQQITVRGMAMTGETSTSTYTLNLSGTSRVYQDVNGDYIKDMDLVEIVSKPSTLGTVSISKAATVADVLTTTDRIGTLEPWERNRRYARVRLLRAVETDATAAESLMFYGKRRLIPMEEDLSAPQLSQIDDILIAFTTADMLERERQYGKAQLKVQEANALLANRMIQERNQKGNRVQIIPQTETYCEEGLMY